ncbi:hypothetical protein GGF32_000060 [Allomyces javanicus]|nr:hypothetical protein GGF32_000060 [Allomyces javanicus]
MLPSGLHTLVLSHNPLLNDTGLQAAFLPTSLCMLDLEGTKVGDGTAAVLLNHMPVWSEWRHMQVHVKSATMSLTVWEQLQAKFLVVK